MQLIIRLSILLAILICVPAGSPAVCCFVPRAVASPDRNTDLQQQLVGSWNVVAFVDVPDGGEPVYQYGKSPAGILIYTSDGHFSASVMAVPAPSAPKDMNAMSVDNWKRLYSAYLSYFGNYQVDPSTKTLIHHVQGSNWPAYNGTDQFRKFKLDGNSLVIYGEYMRSGVRYSYQRVFHRL